MNNSFFENKTLSETREFRNGVNDKFYCPYINIDSIYNQTRIYRLYFYTVCKKKFHARMAKAELTKEIQINPMLMNKPITFINHKDITPSLHLIYMSLFSKLGLFKGSECQGPITLPLCIYGSVFDFKGLEE
ncbi:hypothetical protein Glove_637g29 [Diversispora epigaea]|uniref:Uncharacterized protein n=1 Tax=Diversispora epigaea TaxID=1348612 RepID=A0A397G9J2_9GLOM|nr:hypothetical protein Glove_637g29 [Diversispora epigaea]